LAAGARAREGGRRVMSPVVAPSSGIHGAGIAEHAAPPPRRKAPVCRRNARTGFPSVRRIRLAWWSTGRRCGLADDFRVVLVCTPKYRLGRLTPCGN
jgi:hypothetical protein